jgi:hypothetical protein
MGFRVGCRVAEGRGSFREAWGSNNYRKKIGQCQDYASLFQFEVLSGLAMKRLFVSLLYYKFKYKYQIVNLNNILKQSHGQE